MVTHTIDSYQIQSQKQDQVKVTNLKKLPNIHILDFCQKSWHEAHLLELFDKMYNYEMDPASII